jgi:hypothetical protein
MEATRSQIESLKTLLKEMSAADLSILEAVPETCDRKKLSGLRRLREAKMTSSGRRWRR